MIPMHLNLSEHKVLLSKIDNEVWITFDKYSGTLKEMEEFRKSFDYECYRFGNGYFNSAKWKTVVADDNDHQVYPYEISLCNPEGEIIIISWSDFEILLSVARKFDYDN